jgi:uncharacterized membrane protein
MFIVFVVLVIGFIVLLDARKKISRLETRVTLLENSATQAAVPIIAQPRPLSMPEVDNEPAPSIAMVEPLIVEPIAPAPEPVAESKRTPEPKPNWSLNFEDLFGRRLPIWAGGITLAIAGVLIAKYAIDAGLAKILTPWVRVIGGLVFGVGLIAAAELAWRNERRVNDPRIRQALSGAGIATLYAAVLVAANVYALIGSLAAFVALAVVTAGALGLSVRFGAPSALLGLAGGLAAPALVGGMQPNVPMLAVYLALTIAGLAGVSRMQRWAWLGIIALAGGAGWSLWMIVASNAFDSMASISVGGLVLLLAIGLPMLVLEGPRATMFRSATTLVGAAQLALMVALGGFSMLNWGLFALLAAAGQWLNWRERGFAIVPTIGLALSILLLAIWPHPLPVSFSLIGLALALIHGASLMMSVWKMPAVPRRMVELCALACAVLVVPFVHYYPLFGQSSSRDVAFACVSLGASLIPVTALALAWSRIDRQNDWRFALATATAATLLGVAFCFATLDWMWPVGVAAIGVAVLFFGEHARDARVQTVAAVFAAVSIPLLAITGVAGSNELERLAGIGHDVVGSRDGLRWGLVAAVAIVFAARARPGRTSGLAQIVAAFMGYGAIAQLVPATLLPLVPPLALVGLALASARFVWPRFAPAAGTLAVLIGAWAIAPVEIWLRGATASIVGLPMAIDQDILTISIIVDRLLIPAVAIGFCLRCWREQASKIALRSLAIVAAVIATVAVHTLYRITFAHAVGGNFVYHGMPQRIIWEGLLFTLGWLSFRGPDTFGRRRAAIIMIAAGSLHAGWYTLLLHNPLWAAQAVGPWPMANWIAPAFGMLFGGVSLLRQLIPGKGERPFQLLIMALAIGFAWATLRQAFHGTLLVVPGVSGTEDILRSILAIVLAVGFLLWGIRTQRRDWRIASLVLLIGAVAKVFLRDASGLEGLLRIGSFVALGFSLIGIGWLYSRQLTESGEVRAIADRL